MSPLRISPSRIKNVSGAPLIVGGFGDVQQAELRVSLFGSNTVIALKRLRLKGHGTTGFALLP